MKPTEIESIIAEHNAIFLETDKITDLPIEVLKYISDIYTDRIMGSFVESRIIKEILD